MSLQVSLVRAKHGCGLLADLNLQQWKLNWPKWSESSYQASGPIQVNFGG